MENRKCNSFIICTIFDWFFCGRCRAGFARWICNATQRSTTKLMTRSLSFKLVISEHLLLHNCNSLIINLMKLQYLTRQRIFDRQKTITEYKSTSSYCRNVLHSMLFSKCISLRFWNSWLEQDNNWMLFLWGLFWTAYHRHCNYQRVCSRKRRPSLSLLSPHPTYYIDLTLLPLPISHAIVSTYSIGKRGTKCMIHRQLFRCLIGILPPRDNWCSSIEKTLILCLQQAIPFSLFLPHDRSTPTLISNIYCCG